MHIKQTHMKKEKILMQKVNKSSVKKGAALCLAMAMACTAFVGCGKKDDAASASGATSESAVEVLDNSKLTEIPDEDHHERLCRLYDRGSGKRWLYRHRSL